MKSATKSNECFVVTKNEEVSLAIVGLRTIYIRLSNPPSLLALCQNHGGKSADGRGSCSLLRDSRSEQSEKILDVNPVKFLGKIPTVYGRTLEIRSFRRVFRRKFTTLKGEQTVS